MTKKTGKAWHRPDSDRKRGALVLRSACIETALVLLALAASGSRLAAKKPAPTLAKTISGAVLDHSNNGVPGASVMLTDLETHKGDAMYTGENGVYSFSGLNPNDDYQLQAKYKGHVSDVREVSSLDSRTEIAINLVLRSGKAGALR